MRLQRVELGRDGAPTLGTLVSRDGKFSCVTLERSVNADHPCIPAGTYRVGYAMHHGEYRCPEVLDVPGRTCIHLHIGNRVSDSLGCILVGDSFADDAIEGSVDAFRRMMTYLTGVDSWQLTITNPGAP